jgi:hypothetical protein
LNLFSGRNACLASLLIATTVLPVAADKRRAPVGGEAGTVHVQMHNVMYHFTDDVTVHIQDLDGQLVPQAGNDFPVFDDKNSFSLQLASAKIAITATSLANVLNKHVFAAHDAPLKDVSVRIENGRLSVKGKLHARGDIPFETSGAVSTTADGKILLHAEKISTIHLPVKGIMDLFGVEIADLIKGGKVRGVTAVKDDLVLDPQLILPPPHISGQVTEVSLRGNDVVQTFGMPSATKSVRVADGNYMAYRGNRLRFGKLTMTDADMILIDMDPKDPFDFYLDHYIEQLVAGYTKETSSFGLRVYMRDFNKLSRSKSPALGQISE